MFVGPGATTSACRSPRSPSRRARRSQDTLDPGLEAANPLDAWGTGIDADRIFRECVPRAARRPRHRGAGVRRRPHAAGRAVRRGLPAGRPGRVRGDHEAVLHRCRTWRARSALEEAASCAMRASPCSRARERGWWRCGHLLAQRDAGDRPPLEAPDAGGRGRPRPVAATPQRAARRSTSSRGCACWPTTASRWSPPGRPGRWPWRSGAANELGWPVAIKTAAPGVQHKSDVGGVALGLADADALRDRLRGHRRAARPPGGGRRDGADGRRGRARHRARPHVRAARAGGGRRRPGRAAAGPAARAARRSTNAGRAR